MSAKKITTTDLKNIIKKVIQENYDEFGAHPVDMEEFKRYVEEDFIELEHIVKYNEPWFTENREEALIASVEAKVTVKNVKNMIWYCKTHNIPTDFSGKQLKFGPIAPMEVFQKGFYVKLID